MGVAVAARDQGRAERAEGGKEAAHDAGESSFELRVPDWELHVAEEHLAERDDPGDDGVSSGLRPPLVSEVPTEGGLRLVCELSEFLV